jgi:uncharacterized protein (TIGR03546 family)
LRVIKQTIRLFQVLQSNTHPAEIALGAVLGLYFGLTPSNQTHLIILVLLFFFLKVNRAAAILVFPLAKLVYLAGGWSLADGIGFALLTSPSVPSGLWAFVTHSPVLALLRLDHTLVLGGMVLATAAGIPVFLAVVWAVMAYRASFAEKVSRWNVIKALRGLGLIKWFSDRWSK